MTRDGSALQFAPHALRADAEVVTKAVTAPAGDGRAGDALAYADEELREAPANLRRGADITNPVAHDDERSARHAEADDEADAQPARRGAEPALLEVPGGASPPPNPTF